MENKNSLIPINNCILVELIEGMENVATVEKKYDTSTSGIVVSVSDNSDFLIGKTVFFEEYKDSTRVMMGKTYAFIKQEDIRGYLDKAK